MSSQLIAGGLCLGLVRSSCTSLAYELDRASEIHPEPYSDKTSANQASTSTLREGLFRVLFSLRFIQGLGCRA